MRGLMKGTAFEIEFSMHFEGHPVIRCIDNVYLTSKFLGKPTEIDRLLVSPWGIYSVELKSYSSHLKGELSDEYWMGITGRTTTPIYNPVMQNFEHIRSLKNQIYKVGRLDVQVSNFVVVPDSCVIKTECPYVLNVGNFVNMVHRDSVSKPKLKFNTDEFIRLIEKVRVS